MRRRRRPLPAEAPVESIAPGACSVSHVWPPEHPKGTPCYCGRRRWGVDVATTPTVAHATTLPAPARPESERTESDGMFAWRCGCIYYCFGPSLRCAQHPGDDDCEHVWEETTAQGRLTVTCSKCGECRGRA